MMTLDELIGELPISHLQHWLHLQVILSLMKLIYTHETIPFDYISMCISLILFRQIILKKGMDIVAYRVTVRTQKGFSRFYWLIVKLHKNDGLTKRDQKVISHVSPLREFWLTFRRIWGSTGKLYFKNLCFVTPTLIYSLISKYARINDNGGAMLQVWRVRSYNIWAFKRRYQVESNKFGKKEGYRHALHLIRLCYWN